MNESAVIAVAIVTAVVLGVLAFVTLARRSDACGAGLLSAETCRRDQAARTDAHSPALTDSTIAAAAPTSQIRRDALITAVPRQWKRLPAKRSGMLELRSERSRREEYPRSFGFSRNSLIRPMRRSPERAFERPSEARSAHHPRV